MDGAPASPGSGGSSSATGVLSSPLNRMPLSTSDTLRVPWQALRSHKNAWREHVGIEPFH